MREPGPLGAELSSLTPKQARFVAEYLKDQNATQAAILAGIEFGKPVGFYCYLLVDPRNGQVFYVGKGVRNRLTAHARLARLGVVDNAPKCRRIAEIHEAGLEVEAVVLAGGLGEVEALGVEREVIAALRDTGIASISGGNCTNAERVAEQVAAIRRQMLPVLMWKLMATPEQIAAATRHSGSPEAFHAQILAELDEALAAGGRHDDH